MQPELLDSIPKDLEGVFVPVSGDGTLYSIDFDRYRANLSPAMRRNWDRRSRSLHVKFWLYRHIPWMRWPLLNYVYTFWGLVFEDGLRTTLTPRWGGITFSYLNDGAKPSVWHTWKQVMDPGGPYDGIWPTGAPGNKDEADALR